MCLSDAWLVRVGFNPRSRGGSDTPMPTIVMRRYRFQSTLPWWERQIFLLTLGFSVEVSIHAPVVGATDLIVCHITVRTVSIHAPVVGATINCIGLLNSLICFNPRSRGGSDAFLLN